MKKTAIIAAMMIILTGSAFAGRRTEVSGNSSLPLRAQNFVQEFFPGREAVSIESNGTSFDVSFNDGTKITFTNAGEWKSVSAAAESLSPLLSQGSMVQQGAGYMRITRSSAGSDVVGAMPAHLDAHN